MNYSTRLLFRLLAIFMTGVLSLNVALAQDLSTQTDRTRMGENETMILHIRYEERVSTDAVDLTLLKRDFEVISVIPTQQTRMINGQTSNNTTWRLVLTPKRTGELEIPSFSIGTKRSAPTRITVTKAAKSTNQGAKLTVDLTVERNEIHINEQLTLTLILTAHSSVSRLTAEPFSIPGTEITQLSQSELERNVNGEIYNAVEIKYALFPSQSGEIIVQPRTFSGIVNVPPTQANNFQRGQRLLARTKTLRINVTDPASDPVASQNTPWFPATDVSINATWSSDPAGLKVGEPVTRTIEIKATGQRAAAIPPLAETTANGYRQYADQAKLENSNTALGVVGSRSQGTAIVPGKAGPLELPAQRLTWFDTSARKWRTAELAATTVNVVPAAGAPVNAATPAGNAGLDAPMLAEQGLQATPGINWLTIALGVISAVLAAVCLMLWKRVNALQTTARTDPAVAVSEQQAWKDVIKALARRAPGEARAAITHWFTLPDAVTVGHEQPSEYRDAVAALNAALYAKDAVEPDYAEIRSELEALRNRRNAKATTGTKQSLPELYPQPGGD